jgi:hypothetical protein
MIETVVAAMLLLGVALLAYLTDVLVGRGRLRARRWDHVWQRAQQSRWH